jgi:hypothetical protein
MGLRRQRNFLGVVGAKNSKGSRALGGVGAKVELFLFVFLEVWSVSELIKWKDRVYTEMHHFLVSGGM